MRVRNAGSDGCEMLMRRRRDECNARRSGLHVLTEAGQAGIRLPLRVAVHVRRPGGGTVATDDMFGLRVDVIAEPQIEGAGVAVRRRLGDADNQQAGRGEKTLQLVHSLTSFVS